MLKTLKRRKKDERIFAFSTAARFGWAVLLVLLQGYRGFRLSDVCARKTGKILSVELSKLVNK